jgi:hypothetical protein
LHETTGGKIAKAAMVTSARHIKIVNLPATVDANPTQPWELASCAPHIVSSQGAVEVEKEGGEDDKAMQLPASLPHVLPRSST